MFADYTGLIVGFVVRWLLNLIYPNVLTLCRFSAYPKILKSGKLSPCFIVSYLGQ